MNTSDKILSLSGFAFGSSVTGSFLYILPKICSNPIHGFGVIATFIMFIAGLCSGLLSGLIFGFFVWILFRVSKSGIYKAHYILISLLGVFIGFWLMRFLNNSGVFLR